MKSPNGKIEVVCSDYGEIRMGSPEFGNIKIVGTSFSTNGRSFGDAMAFSPDSRYFAIAELVDASRPSTRVVAFDLKRKAERIVFVRDPGLIKKLDWISPDEMKISSWSHLYGDEVSSWRAPVEEAACESKPWWKNLF
jgi:hypothetical protein